MTDETSAQTSKKRCFHDELRRDRHDGTGAYLEIWYCPEPLCDFEINLCKHNNQRQGERGPPYCADCGAQMPESLRPAPETIDCHIRPHDFCSAGTCAVCMDAARYRFIRRSERVLAPEHEKEFAEMWADIYQKNTSEFMDRRIDQAMRVELKANAARCPHWLSGEHKFERNLQTTCACGAVNGGPSHG